MVLTPEQKARRKEFYRRSKRYGRAPREYRRDSSKEYLDEIRMRYLDGQPFTEIARALGKDHTTIIYQVKKMNFTRPAVIPTRPKSALVCSIVGCDKPHNARGLCHKHYVEEMRRQAANKQREMDMNPRCDHSTSRCECVNRGKKSYADYVREAGMRLPKKEKGL